MAALFYCSQLCKLILASKILLSNLSSHWFWFVQSQAVWILKKKKRKPLREICVVFSRLQVNKYTLLIGDSRDPGAFDRIMHFIFMKLNHCSGTFININVQIIICR